MQYPQLIGPQFFTCSFNFLIFKKLYPHVGHGPTSTPAAPSSLKPYTEKEKRKLSLLWNTQRNKTNETHETHETNETNETHET